MSPTKHVFGPVPSRRLGRSLGVDLVPMKTCPYDCIYCQLCATTDKTTARAAWVPVETVLAELREALAAEPDYVTLSGSGEPTLYADLGPLIAGIKAMTDVPVAVLTNGALLGRPEVRAALMRADLVVPSLDAGDAATWQRINRPAAGLTFEEMVAGLERFVRDFAGQVWLEVVFVAGVNDDEASADRIAALARRLGPDRVQLNTVTRPPAEPDARPVAKAHLEALAARFDPPAEVVADFRGTHEDRAFADAREAVLETLKRRPCTIRDVADGLGLHPTEVTKHVGHLVEVGLVSARPVEDRVYYAAAGDPPPAGPEKGETP